MSEDDLKKIVKDSVGEVFLSLGVDISEPEAVLALQDDFRHLREWRESTKAFRRHGALAIIGIAVSGVCALVWMGLQGMFNSH